MMAKAVARTMAPVRVIPVADAGRRRLALHEAAHAVVALALKYPVAYVTVNARAWEPRLGHMMPVGTPTSVGTFAIVLLAGGQAEVKAFGFAEFDHTDQRECRHLFAQCTGIPVDDARLAEDVRVYAELAAEAVADDWPWITKVATRLERCWVLSGDDVRRLRPEE
jgi:hypothetical protein